MKRLNALIPVFAIAFLVFLLGPPLLGKPFSPYPLMQIADVFDVFTPLVLLPLYWLLFQLGEKEPIKLSGIIAFLYLRRSGQRVKECTSLLIPSGIF
jgi:hypothetical protein